MAINADWLLVDPLTVLQAASLWAGVEPHPNLFAFWPEDDRRRVQPFTQMLLSAIAIGELKALKQSILDDTSWRVSRKDLLALAAMKGQRPAFLFDTPMPAASPLSIVEAKPGGREESLRLLAAAARPKPAGNDPDAFSQTYWTLVQAVAWAFRRTKEAVQRVTGEARSSGRYHAELLLADGQTVMADQPAGPADHLTLFMEAASEGAKTYFPTVIKAADAILEHMRAKKLVGYGRANGQGDLVAIQSTSIIDAQVTFLPDQIGPPPFESGTRWHDARFKRADVMALWPSEAETAEQCSASTIEPNRPVSHETGIQQPTGRSKSSPDKAESYQRHPTGESAPQLPAVKRHPPQRIRDEISVLQARALMKEGKAKSIREAASILDHTGNLPGGGTFDSRVRRLQRRMQENPDATRHD